MQSVAPMAIHLVARGFLGSAWTAQQIWSAAAASGRTTRGIPRLGAWASRSQALQFAATPDNNHPVNHSQQQKQEQQQATATDATAAPGDKAPPDTPWGHPSAAPPGPTGHMGPAARGMMPHAIGKGPLPFNAVPEDVGHAMANPTYGPKYLASVHPQHLRPDKFYQKVGFHSIQAVRCVFDKVTGYGPNMTEAQWLRRMLFLETVAGVPGMVAGMLRHLKSLRLMEKDNGWINTLLQEAENERMHLLTFLTLRDPGIIFRAMVILAQGAFFNFYFLAYLLSPRTCHSMVGYLEEEAVKTYTHALKDIDDGKLWANTPAPAIAIDYWRLPKDATMRDIILVIRADEACHSHVNHTFSNIGQNAPNPFHYGSNHPA